MVDYYCAWKQSSTDQRISELSRGDGLSGTQGFQDNGCYKCDGLDQICDRYFNKEVMKIQKLNKIINNYKNIKVIK